MNGITNCVLLDEPPCTDPYARWCERGRLAAASYSIVSDQSEVLSRAVVVKPVLDGDYLTPQQLVSFYLIIDFVKTVEHSGMITSS